MSKTRSAKEQLDEGTLPIVPGRKSRVGKQTLLDPQAPLPGALKRVGPKPVKTKEQLAEQEKSDPKHLRQRFSLYCKKLAEYGGDPVPALAVVFDVTEEEARERQVELHQEITRAVNVLSNKELFDMNGISKQHRLMRLREMMYSDHPAVVLKSLDMLNDMDTGSKSSGDTWEEWAAMAMGKR